MANFIEFVHYVYWVYNNIYPDYYVFTVKRMSSSQNSNFKNNVFNNNTLIITNTNMDNKLITITSYIDFYSLSMSIFGCNDTVGPLKL